jgi:hypothetical protein
MNGTNETTEYVNREYEQLKSDRDTVVRYAAEVVWAGLRFAVALIAAAGVAWSFHAGVIAPWLDANGGHWAWMGAGALVAFLVLDELPDSLRLLDEALIRLWLVRRAIAKGLRR